MSIAVVGATGRTGGLVVAELERLGARCVVAGRDPRRLAALARDHGNVDQVRRVAVDEPAALRAALDGATVVVNCVEARAALGEHVVRAAIDVGAHYADAAGEQAFIRTVFERYGERAARRGVALVPALGFDYALGDCLARAAAAGHEPLRDIVLAYALEGGSVASDSVSAPAGGPEVVYREGAWRPAPGGVERMRFVFPEPLGRQPMQRYGSGEVVTVPRHTQTRRVTTLITASSWSPHPALVPLVPYLRPLAARARRIGLPLGTLLSALRPRTDGASPSTGRFTIAAVARGRDGGGRALARGRDFYGLTGVALARGARLLAAKGHRPAGALPPAVAFDPAAFLDGLADRGVSWERA